MTKKEEGHGGSGIHNDLNSRDELGPQLREEAGHRSQADHEREDPVNRVSLQNNY